MFHSPQAIVVFAVKQKSIKEMNELPSVTYGEYKK